jgi:hypothetical protein
MYTEVDLYAKVRRAVMVESMSERAAARKFGISLKGSVAVRLNDNPGHA